MSSFTTPYRRDSASPSKESGLDHRTIPPLGWTGPTFVQIATSAINRIENFYSTLASRPTLPSVNPGYLQDLLPTEAPRHGEDWTAIEQDIESALMPGLTHWQSPKFMALFPASSTYPGIMGDIYSAAFTAPGFNWACSPAHTELEVIVMDWLAKIMNLPEAFHSKGPTGGGGVIQGSASEGVLVTMIAARERFVRRQVAREGIRDPEAIEARSHELKGKIVAMASDQAHSCSQKAAMVIGARFRSIPTAFSNIMDGPGLRRAIEELVAKGLQPFFLTVCIGTTSTCSIDDLASIAKVAQDYPDVWIHCDAAYVGAALVCPEYHFLSEQLAFVDSVDINLHKWLLTNHDASCLYIRNRHDLIGALSVTRNYLNNDFSDGGASITDYRDWQIPLGRRFRSLKIWFMVRTYGVDGMHEHIRHHIALGNLFAGLIRSRTDLFTLFCPQAFALTVFTVNPRGTKPLETVSANGNGRDAMADVWSTDTKLRDETSEITREVFTRIDAQREFALTGSMINGVYTIRVVPSNPLAEEKYVRQVFDLLVSTVLELL